MLRRRFLASSLLALAAAGCDVQRSAPTTTAATKRPEQSAVPAGFGDDYAAALAEAARERKPLILYFSADWCSYCRQLEREVLEKPEFRAAAAKFVCVRIDGSRQTGRCNEYRVRAFPTLVLADPAGTAIERIVGLSTPTAVLAQMNAAVTSVVAAREFPGDAVLTR